MNPPLHSFEICLISDSLFCSRNSEQDCELHLTYSKMKPTIKKDQTHNIYCYKSDFKINSIFTPSDKVWI